MVSQCPPPYPQTIQTLPKRLAVLPHRPQSLPPNHHNQPLHHHPSHILIQRRPLRPRHPRYPPLQPPHGPRSQERTHLHPPPRSPPRGLAIHPRRIQNGGLAAQFRHRGARASGDGNQDREGGGMAAYGVGGQCGCEWRYPCGQGCGDYVGGCLYRYVFFSLSLFVFRGALRIFSTGVFGDEGFADEGV